MSPTDRPLGAAASLSASGQVSKAPRSPAAKRRRLKRLRAKLAAGLARIALIRQRNRRRRRAIKRLRDELGATAMFDSVDTSQIPSSAPAVAGYVDGAWPTFNSLHEKFPHAWRLPIAVFARDDAECLDIEPGDAMAGEAAAWVRRRQARGVRRPVLYCSVSQADSLLELLRLAGVKREEVRIWTAHYTFAPHLCGPHSCGELRSASADATQWTDQALGRNLDQSLVREGFWG